MPVDDIAESSGHKHEETENIIENNIDDNLDPKKHLSSSEMMDDERSYKNVSINSILNIHGRNAVAATSDGQGGARLPSIGSTINSTKPPQANLQSSSYPQYYNNRVISNIDSRITTSGPYYDQHIQTSKSHPPSNYNSSVYQKANMPNMISSNPQVSPTYSQNILQVSYPQVNQYGQPTSNLNSQVVQTGAPINIPYHALQAQTHSASDLDPLHENKRGRRFRRRYNQIVRKYSCSFPGCVKSYGSLNHLNTHIVTKKHGHRKSKADFQHNHLLHDDPSKSHYQDGLQSQTTHSEYTSGNYWYGFPVQARNSANQSIGLSEHPSIMTTVPQPQVQPPQPPPGYMYYAPSYSTQQVQQSSVQQQRLPISWQQQQQQQQGYPAYAQQSQYTGLTASDQIQVQQPHTDQSQGKSMGGSSHP